MSGQISIVACMPKAGKEAELRQVLADRLPLLRELGLATDRPEILMRSEAGALIQVSEWASEAAIDRAHREPRVLELWQRFDACCTFPPLNSLAETAGPFATFAAER